MSDFEQLLLILGAIYLFECVWSVAPGSVLVTNFFTQHPILRRFSCSTQYDRKSWHLLSILPFGMAYACQRWPIAISPQAICSSSTTLDEPVQCVAFDRIQSVTVMDKEIFVNHRVFAKTVSHAMAEHLARLLNQLRTCDVDQRANIIDSAIHDSLDSQKVKARIELTAKRLSRLRMACTVLFGVLFLATPTASRWLPWPSSLWWLLPLFFLNLIVVIGMSYRYEKDWYGRGRIALLGHVLLQTIAPTEAMRSGYTLSRDLLATFHPLAVTQVLCDRAEWMTVAQRTLLEARYPMGPNLDIDETSRQTENWFNERLADCVTRCLGKAEVDVAQMLGPPVQESNKAVAYCPRCLSQFIDVEATCAQCGGRTLEVITMTQETCYRRTMLEELELMAEPGKLDKWAEKYPFVDAKEETISNWVDYYEEPLLDAEAFKREFMPQELKAIQEFTLFMRQRTKDDWGLIPEEAKLLLSVLSGKDGINP